VGPFAVVVGALAEDLVGVGAGVVALLDPGVVALVAAPAVLAADAVRATGVLRGAGALRVPALVPLVAAVAVEPFAPPLGRDAAPLLPAEARAPDPPAPRCGGWTALRGLAGSRGLGGLRGLAG
jgi:hypothetical protein